MSCGSCGTCSCSCNQAQNEKHGIRKISAEELKEKNDSGLEHVVVNVLNEQYFDGCNIKGSINIPLMQLSSEVIGWDKNKEIIVYCASYECSASSKAYEILDKMGFKNIYAYEGGIKEWREKKYPIVGECVGG